MKLTRPTLALLFFGLTFAGLSSACSAVLDIYELPEDAGRDAHVDAKVHDAGDDVHGTDATMDAGHTKDAAHADHAIDAPPMCDGGCVEGGSGWPFGVQACHVTEGTTWYLRVGSVVDCTSLVIDPGGTLELVPPDEWDGGPPPAFTTPTAWTVIGVADAAVINGKIEGVWRSNGNSVTVTGRAPRPDGTDGGEPLTWTFVQSPGGKGGIGGFNCTYAAEGGAPSYGNGGGGGGGATGEGSNDSTYCGNVCPNAASQDSNDFGPGTPGGPPNRVAAGVGGNGKNTGQLGGSSTRQGGGGGNADARAGDSPGASSVGGGGGGFRGALGGLLYLRVRGSFSGTGTITLAGTPGGAGGMGGAFVGTTEFVDLEDSVCTAGGYSFASGGAGGGGGGGGAGGVLILHNGIDAGALPVSINVSGGPAGAGGGSRETAGVGANGDAGAPGLVAVEPF